MYTCVCVHVHVYPFFLLVVEAMLWMADESSELSTGVDMASGNEGAELTLTSVTSDSPGGEDGGVANSSSMEGTGTLNWFGPSFVPNINVLGFV